MAQPAATSSSASGRRRAQRKIAGWVAVFCFGGTRRERGGEQALAAEGTPRWRKPRTVPVDGDVMRRGVGDKASLKGPRLQGCCFLAPERKNSNSTMDSGNGADDKQRQQEQTKPPPPRSPSEPPAPSQMQATTDGSRWRREEQPRGGAPAETRARAADSRPSVTEAPSKREAPARGACPAKASSASGVGAFGPVVGLSVVAAVSMAGLLGGRLWAVTCVCAWLAALSRISRRAGGCGMAGSHGGGEEAVADVDSTDYKKLVVLRGLLERDRTKAVKA